MSNVAMAVGREGSMVAVGGSVAVSVGRGVAVFVGGSVLVGWAVNVPATMVPESALMVALRSGVADGVGADPQAVRIASIVMIRVNFFI